MLMAEVEEAADAPAGVVREWLFRASRAPRDAVWVADGVVSERWLPVSAISGRLDAFEWRLPPGESMRALAAPEAPTEYATIEPEPERIALPLPAPEPSAVGLERPPMPDDPGPPPVSHDNAPSKRGWFS